MKTKLNSSQLISLILGLAFISALMFAINGEIKNKNLNKEIDKERLNAENLLSEKLALKKDLGKKNNELSTVKGKNQSLDKQISKVNQQIALKDAEIKRLLKESSDAKAIRAKYDELQALQDELNRELYGLNKKIENLNQEKLALNEAIQRLQNDKQELSENIQLIAANNFLIEALKGKKEKLTVSAKKTNKIKADFDIPTHIEAQLNFVIKGPDGLVVDSKNDTSITLNTVSVSASELLASNSAATGVPVATKRVKMVYQPLEKLTAGIYRIDVYNNGTYLGTSQVKLK